MDVYVVKGNVGDGHHGASNMYQAPFALYLKHGDQHDEHHKRNGSGGYAA